MTHSLPRSFDSRTTMDKIPRPHYEATVNRIIQEALVMVVQKTRAARVVGLKMTGDSDYRGQTMPAIFDPHQRATLEAATGRIIPADRDPGALEAGVIDYIENTLATYEAEHAPLYVDGIQELDRLAGERFGCAAFVSLQPEQQDQILTLLEKQRSPFFSLLLEHTMQGFYGDPRHGGNRNRVGWKVIGFPGPSRPEGYRPPFGWYDENIPDEFEPEKKRGK